eukprot:g9302.t1
METSINTSSADGRRPARHELADKSDEDNSGARSITRALPEVVHVTMGIKEDDWPGAVRFAAASNDFAADNLRTTSGAGHDQQTFHPETEDGTNRSPATTAAPHYFRFGLGLHPWSAHSRSDEWLQNLTALLEEHPQALVGEIGLDKVARTPETRRVEWDHQLEVFRAQMALAAELSRPTSVHCVKAYGKIVDFLREADQNRPAGSGECTTSRGTGGAEKSSGESRGGGGVDGDGSSDDFDGLQRRRVEVGGCGRGGDEPLECGAGRSPGGGPDLERDSGTADWRRRRRLLPPRIALHSFTGSVEVAKDITRLGRRGECDFEVFFGFSAAVNMRGDREMKRLMDVLRVVPDSRILIETDRQVMVGAANELLRVCGAIAEAKGVSVAEAAELANRNATLFLAKL